MNGLQCLLDFKIVEECSVEEAVEEWKREKKRGFLEKAVTMGMDAVKRMKDLV